MQHFHVLRLLKPLQSDKYMGHISLFLVVKMKDKFPSRRLFHPKFSQRRNIKCLTEERRKNCQKKQFGYSFLCSMPEIHFIPLLFMGSLAVDNGNYLRSKIISGPFWGSFAVLGSFVVGDHLRYFTDLLSQMTSSLLTIAITVFNVYPNVYSE